MGAVKFKRIPVYDKGKIFVLSYIYKCKRCKQTMNYAETDKHALDHKGTTVVIDIS